MQHIQTRRWDAILKLKPKETVNTSKLFTLHVIIFKNSYFFHEFIMNVTFIVMTDRMSEIVAARQSRPWIQPNFLFQMSEYSSKQRKVLGVLHGFTDDVSSWLFLFWVALHYNVRMKKKQGITFSDNIWYYRSFEEGKWNENSQITTKLPLKKLNIINSSRKKTTVLCQVYKSISNSIFTKINKFLWKLVQKKNVWLFWIFF